MMVALERRFKTLIGLPSSKASNSRPAVDYPHPLPHSSTMARVCRWRSLRHLSQSAAGVNPAPLPPRNFEMAVALALVRPPLVAPPMKDIEQRYDKISQRMELVRSLKSDIEMRQDEDAILTEKRKQLVEEGKDTVAVDEQLRSSAQFLIDDWNERAINVLERYKFHGLHPDSGAQSSQVAEERLDQKLVLLVRQRFDAKSEYASPWTLPHVKTDGSESLRQTAETCLGNIVKDSIEVQILGNAPFACYEYTYPKRLADRLKMDGMTFFLFTAQMADPKRWQVEWNNDVVADHKWCTREEAGKLLGKYRQFSSAVKSLLVE